MNYSDTFLESVAAVCMVMQTNIIENMAVHLSELRGREGRLFILGVGGSAANASHAVNDFRKLCNIDAYAPTDNVAELSARTNDEGWETTFEAYLKTCRLSANDAILVLSVGGGNAEKNVSPNLVRAVDYAASIGAEIMGIVGRDGGHTKKAASFQTTPLVHVIPSIDAGLITPITESFQSVICHMLVSHPLMAQKQAKWESL